MGANDSPTRGAPYIVTGTEDVGHGIRLIRYLLQSGERRQIHIAASHDTPELRHQMGVALAGEDRRIKGKRVGSRGDTSVGDAAAGL